MINVLFFAYEFPPVQTTGSIRPVKFVKYLKQFGINPIVITTDIESGKRAFDHAKIDESLLADLPNDVEIIRIPTMDYSDFYKNKFKNIKHHYFSVSDHIEKHWGENVNNEITTIIKKYKPQLIYATAPPFGTATIVSNIANRFNLPLVMDMRDHWSHWGTGAYISKLHYLATLKSERKVFTTATKVISVTQQVINDFINVHPNLPESKFTVIPNGFESEMMNYADIQLNKKDKYIIGYMGEFYYSPLAHQTIFKKWYKKRPNRMFQYIPRIEDYKYRSPYYFFKTLKQLFIDTPELKNKIEFHYIGGHKDWLIDMVKEFDLEKNTIFHGRVNYSESLEIAKTFDFCLATSVKVPNGEDYALASKTFDYLLLRKPILGFVTKGSQKYFLENSGVAFVFNPDDAKKSSIQLKELLGKTELLIYNTSFLKEYERINSAKKLANIFNEIVK